MQKEKTPMKIFLDTDLGGDCDDVGAIAVLNVLANNNYADIIGMTHTTSLYYGPACIDIVNRFYNRIDIPIGAYSKNGFHSGKECNIFAEKMGTSFYSPYSDRSKAMDATKLFRKTLSSQDNESCIIVGIGQLNNLANLLKSTPDEYSSLNGRDLMKEKVKECVLMAGMFNGTGETINFENSEYEVEYNIKCDIESAKYFIDNCPIPITFSDFLLGQKVKTFGPLVMLGNMSNPITFAYKHFCGCARESWDPLTVYYAVTKDMEMFNLSNYGIVQVNDLGETNFINNINGKHRYLRLKVDYKTAASVIDELIMKDKVE